MLGRSPKKTQFMQVYHVTTSQSLPQIFPAPDPDGFFAALPSAPSGEPVTALECEGFQFEVPQSEPAGFYRLSNRFLVFDRAIYMSDIGRLLDYAGNAIETQIFGLPESVFFLDVTAEYNCIDIRKSEFFDRRGSVVGTDTGMGVKSASFFTKLIGDSSIFRIPQKRSSLFTVSADSESPDDFYHVYHSLELTGLNFDLIWKD
jgi:hypothetical protein